MKQIRFIMIFVLLNVMSVSAWAKNYQPYYTPGELDEMLASIALYPDPLLAQILPACTYPEQLAEADRFTRHGKNAAAIDHRNWDVSVKAIAHYPSVLEMLVNAPDWTSGVGQAYIDQPDDVMDSIQRLRSRAMLNDYLVSNSYQRVYRDGRWIRIVPARPTHIYVPQYSPVRVYVERRRPSESLDNVLSFTLGFLIGAWLDRDVDWGSHRIYYHGWKGKGWIGQARPHVNILNVYYVNDKWINISISLNPNIRTLDTKHFRENLRRSTGSYTLVGPRIKTKVTKTGPNLAQSGKSRNNRSNVSTVKSPRKSNAGKAERTPAVTKSIFKEHSSGHRGESSPRAGQSGHADRDGKYGAQKGDSTDSKKSNSGHRDGGRGKGGHGRG